MKSPTLLRVPQRNFAIVAENVFEGEKYFTFQLFFMASALLVCNGTLGEMAKQRFPRRICGRCRCVCGWVYYTCILATKHLRGFRVYFECPTSIV